MNISDLSQKEKIAIVCLYYARLNKEESKKEGWANVKKEMAEKYIFKPTTIQNYRDVFDAQYPDNGRKGWYQKPIEKQNQLLADVFDKYKNTSTEELKKVVNEILMETLEGENYYSIKTKDPEVVKGILAKKNNTVFPGINILENEIKKGQLVFIALGGDKPEWDTGLVGVGIVSKEPYDKGYDPNKKKNFKINVQIKLLLENPIKRDELIPYINAYNIHGVSPMTKSEANQALSKVGEKKAIALMRGMIELRPECEPEIKELIDEDTLRRVKSVTQKLIKIENSYHGNGPGENVLLYGVPGVGKSHYIENEYKVDDDKMERVIFHPDYLYSDFVGQVMPSVKKTKDGESVVEYEFRMGPFTSILKKAINDSNPENMYYLVIEELNRGNAPAIFGDIFQLLDRDEEGRSKFEITNYDIAEQVYSDGDRTRKVYIPSNLTLLATMNTADQNVFTLDTAFQRRWNMKLMPNDFHSEENQEQYDTLIDKDIKWGDFAVKINEIITEFNEERIGFSDKRMGVYFMMANDLTNKERFASKVLKYLWDDAFKMQPDHIFDSDIRQLEDLFETFMSVDGDESALREVLNDDVYNRIIGELDEDE